MLKYLRDRRTINRRWLRGQTTRLGGGGPAIVASRIRGNSSRKKTRTSDEIEAAIRAVPHDDRQTMRSLAARTCIPMTTLHRHKANDPKFSPRSN
ncbi:hypothetical protein ACHHYP_12199 [Achlya hypogyna]|uniref:Uncharacterized protein n=1 Tax=Achlya hypogyna TaxID=1202772 RepID=A0A1V9YHG2_ACHHY|nr:hypothetical protein ACHHYP_12199 [Achlya hypogyna]